MSDIFRLTYDTSVSTDDVGTLTWTAGSGATRQTSVVKYGSGAMQITGSSQRFLNSSASTAFQSAPTAFCIESWLAANATGGTCNFNCGGFNNGITCISIGLTLDSANNRKQVNWYAWNGSEIFSRTAFVSGYDTSYHHYAMSWDGSTYRLFADGAILDTFTSSTGPATSAGDTSQFGWSGNIPNVGTSYFDNGRGKLNEAVYTSAFTPSDFNSSPVDTKTAEFEYEVTGASLTLNIVPLSSEYDRESGTVDIVLSQADLRCEFDREISSVALTNAYIVAVIPYEQTWETPSNSDLQVAGAEFDHEITQPAIPIDFFFGMQDSAVEMGREMGSLPLRYFQRGITPTRRVITGGLRSDNRRRQPQANRRIDVMRVSS